MSRPIRVLVVEDCEDDALLAMRMLRRGGLEPTYRRVQDIDSLRAALDEDRWDAVISDFTMPGFSGLKALNVLRETGLDIPFIFVSGTIGEEIAVEAMKAGASDYVMKQNLARLAPVLERELAQATIRQHHRQVEADLRKYELQLHHAQKMESLGTLAGGIAHDFNNILGVILGNAVLACAEVGIDSTSLPYLSEIQKAALRARNLVRQILTFSRGQPPELVTQPLRPIVEETHRMLRSMLPARVELDFTLTDATLHVHADATQIQQVLMNLCTNAWQALEDGIGRVGIGLEAVELDDGACQRLGGLTRGAYAHLWVSDTGLGMDAATRERIFEPFFTTKPVGQGTGLGLAVVHGIVAGHQGAVNVESEPGRGSVFHLHFPVFEPDPAAPAAPSADIEASHGNGRHVLYVDDDETMVVMVTHLLQHAGYQVDGFQNAKQAIEAVREDPEGFDIVVTDYNMPEYSGLDVAQALSRIRPGLPVVISSGYITDELRIDARNVGVKGLLEKENTFQELGNLVGRLLA